MGVSAQGDKTAGLGGGLDADALALRVDDVKAVLVDVSRQLPFDQQGGMNLSQSANEVPHFGGLYAKGFNLQLEQCQVLVAQDVELGEREQVVSPGRWRTNPLRHHVVGWSVKVRSVARQKARLDPVGCYV